MDILLDTHCHTVASGHAFSTIKECFEEAAKKGLKLLCITDHAPNLPGSADPLFFLNLKSLPSELFGVELFTGVELNILNDKGEIDLSEKILNNLDMVIASLHLPCMKSGGEEYNTNAVINAIKNPYVKIIGHLGDPRYPINFEKIVDCAKEYGVVIEINEKSSNPDSGVRSGGVDNVLEIARLCAKKEVPVVLASDAHFYQEIASLEYAKKLAEKAELPDHLILNYSVEKFKEIMRKPKSI